MTEEEIQDHLDKTRDRLLKNPRVSDSEYYFEMAMTEDWAKMKRAEPLYGKPWNLDDYSNNSLQESANTI